MCEFKLEWLCVYECLLATAAELSEHKCGILITYLKAISTQSHFATLSEVCLSLTLRLSAFEQHMFCLASCHTADISCDPWADVLSRAARPSGFCTQVWRSHLRCPLNAPSAAVFCPSRGQQRFTSPPQGASWSLHSMGDHNLQEIKAHCRYHFIEFLLHRHHFLVWSNTWCFHLQSVAKAWAPCEEFFDSSLNYR